MHGRGACRATAVGTFLDLLACPGRPFLIPPAGLLHRGAETAGLALRQGLLDAVAIHVLPQGQAPRAGHCGPVSALSCFPPTRKPFAPTTSVEESVRPLVWAINPVTASLPVRHAAPAWPVCHFAHPSRLALRVHEY